MTSIVSTAKWVNSQWLQLLVQQNGFKAPQIGNQIAVKMGLVNIFYCYNIILYELKLNQSFCWNYAFFPGILRGIMNVGL